MSLVLFERNHRAIRQLLTGTSVGELDSVCKIRSRVIALVSVSSPIVPDEFGVDVDSRDIIDDATNLQFRVLQQVSEQRCLACTP